MEKKLINYVNKTVFYRETIEISIKKVTLQEHTAIDKRWSHVFRRKKCITKKGTEAGRPFSLKNNTEDA